MDLLENSVGRRLVFIQAPAGFGKTTLVADWLAASRRPFAWIGIDREERDADAFLARLEASVDFAIGAEPRGSRLSVPTQAAREACLLSVAGRIADTGQPLVLVIDDFHNLKDSGGQSLVSRLCDFLPEGTTLVVASREGIPFPVGRLRARGELAELGVEELRFRLPEVREFLARVSPGRLSDEDAASLEGRTEGWIAGLQLAVIALRDGRDPRGFIDAFGGSSRTVYDFLSEEALASLPPADLEFLTALSVVDCFSASLCEALTAGLPAADPAEGCAEDARTRLHRLERDCLFMVPLDDERSRYRFHVLFREALLGRLRATDPGRERGLRLAASAWLEAHGHPAEAMRQAVLAGDAGRAGALAEGYALSLLERGDLAELRAGFEALSLEGAAAGPWFRLAACWAAAYAGQLDEAVARVEMVAEAEAGTAALLAAARGGRSERFRTSMAQDPCDAGELEVIALAASGAASRAPREARKLAGQVETLRAYLAVLQAENRVAADRATRALALLPEGDLVPRCHAETTLANALYGLGADLEAAPVYVRAMETARKAGMRHVRYLAAAGLANLRLARGDLDGAKQLCLATAAEPGAEDYPALGDLHVILSQVEWERNEVAAALEEGRRGLELCRRWGQADSLVAAYVTLATALSAAGEAESALALLARASGLESGSTWLRLNLEEAAASIDLERGNRGGADAFCSRPQPIRTYEGFYTVSHWLILRRRPAEALPYLEVMREKGELRGTLPRLAEGYVLFALAAKARGERAEARAWLDRALGIAAPRGLVMRFIRRGEGVAELLRERQADFPDHFVERLLAAFDQSAARRAAKLQALRASCSPRGESAIEVLSPREVEVLRLLGEGLTAEEIASRSFVASSTVRSHIKAVYGKLGVHRRVEALKKATELGIV